LSGWLIHVEAAADAFAAAPLFGVMLARAAGYPRLFRFFWAVNDLGGMAAAALKRHWLDASLFAAAGLLALLWDWWQRKGRKAAAQLGAKSRAVIAGLVDKLRGALEPVPEGVGA
jgi:hypothetical protein